ncbi:MAG TPA: NAD(P)/FAD-dependent oxidoreductase [Desulfobulbaceae bacterium]|nr:NAD(P)/FAD-dependent oxidoreductase [Desulfobulbaceae bacterium]HHD64130.1 NAD(P)/FAD-dependent oxidoreductase [Desulfobulbaceae bacterium]
MADYQLIIIGGGLSGLAAGIRAARFGLQTLILEQHSLPGGLNSYYFRHGHLLETGLHAMTNFAQATDKRAPLNRLFRQLKLSRKRFVTREQFSSEIIFPESRLCFANDLSLLEAEVAREFPASSQAFLRLVRRMKTFDPFAPAPWRSTRTFLHEQLDDPLLENMLLLPLMVYGNSEEYDMNLAQFAIMFRALFLEGFFRPEKTIREFLDLLVGQYRNFGGALRFNVEVEEIVRDKDRVSGVRLSGGELLRAEAVLSTVGLPGTAKLSGWALDPEQYTGRMSFMETISLLPESCRLRIRSNRTILFYSMNDDWQYKRPSSLIEPSWGVICFPENFHGIAPKETFQLRITNAADYDRWRQLDTADYGAAKERCCHASAEMVGKIVGNYEQDIVYQDSFTPLTIERYTGKGAGAVYGSPVKIKDGCTPLENLYIAGTDQGYLGIVGSMLSGVTIINQHLLR